MTEEKFYRKMSEGKFYRKMNEGDFIRKMRERLIERRREDFFKGSDHLIFFFEMSSLDIAMTRRQIIICLRNDLIWRSRVAVGFSGALSATFII